MDEFLKWLSANPMIATTLLISLIVLLLTITLIYVVAFIQGREVFFWPPKIGQKPEGKRLTEKTRMTGSVGSLEIEDLRIKSNFFEINPNEDCLIVMSNHPESKGRMSHGDVETLVEAVKIIYELGGKVIVAPFDKIIEPAGDVTEFCIGGPDSNKRTQAHLDKYLKGIRINAYSPNDPDSIAIRTREEKFRYEKDEKIFAILAKFRSNPNSRPVFLICGHTAIANKGAVYYLSQNYDKFLREKFEDKSFCIIVKIISPTTYGYKGVELVKDITDVAFKPWLGVESRPTSHQTV